MRSHRQPDFNESSFSRDRKLPKGNLPNLHTLVGCHDTKLAAKCVDLSLCLRQLLSGICGLLQLLPQCLLTLTPWASARMLQLLRYRYRNQRTPKGRGVCCFGGMHEPEGSDPSGHSSKHSGKQKQWCEYGIVILRTGLGLVDGCCCGKHSQAKPTHTTHHKSVQCYSSQAKLAGGGPGIE